MVSNPYELSYYVDYNKKIEKKFLKLLKASQIIRDFLKARHEILLRVAKQEDCLAELDELLPDIDNMLDDDVYYEELAWEIITKSKNV